MKIILIVSNAIKVKKGHKPFSYSSCGLSKYVLDHNIFSSYLHWGHSNFFLYNNATFQPLEVYMTFKREGGNIKSFSWTRNFFVEWEQSNVDFFSHFAQSDIIEFIFILSIHSIASYLRDKKSNTVNSMRSGFLLCMVSSMISTTKI